MSYDVAVSLGANPPSAEELREYFRGRRWYEDDGDRAVYADIDTGVAFEADWEGDGEVDEVLFELQEGRPRVYGRETSEELEAFADAFSDALDEPFDAEAFVEAWEAANERAIASDPGDATPDRAVDDEELEATWRWNRVRREIQENLGGSMFVPRILYFRDDEGLQRGIIWPDAIPMALPEVDFVLISVPEHVDPSQDASRAHRIPYEEFVEAASEVAEKVDEPVSHLQLRWSEAPTDVIESLTGEDHVANPEDLTGLAIDRIFEASLVQTE